MAAYTPINDQFKYIARYKALYYQGNTDKTYTLAPPTGGAQYVPGLLMATYTGGPNVGMFVNYSSAGTNGQNVCVGWLDDQDLSYDESLAGLAQAKVKFGNAMVMDDALVALTDADIVTGMTSLYARKITNISGVDIWYVP